MKPDLAYGSYESEFPGAAKYVRPMKLPLLRKRLTFASLALVSSWCACLLMSAEMADKYIEILREVTKWYLLGQSASDTALAWRNK